MQTSLIQLGIFLSLLCTSCVENEQNEYQETATSEVIKPRKFGIYSHNNNYIIDTAVVLSNQNLLPLLHALENENLSSKSSYAETPWVVRQLLDSLSGGFDMTNPGENWQVGCTDLRDATGSSILPKRQLLYVGTNDHFTLMTYYSGGFGKTTHTLIIQHNSQSIIDLWKGSGLHDYQNKTDIIQYLQQAHLQNKPLNINIIFF